MLSLNNCSVIDHNSNPKKADNNLSFDLNSSSLYLLQKNISQILNPNVKINSFLNETNTVLKPQSEVVEMRSEKYYDGSVPLNAYEEASKSNLDADNDNEKEEEKNEVLQLNLNMSLDCIDRQATILNNPGISAVYNSLKLQEDVADNATVQPNLELIGEVQSIPPKLNP